MDPKRIIPIALLLIATACGRGSKGTMQRGLQSYDVVQEGQASGATSTLAAPGETPPPITNTAVDTTTNFTLPGTVAGTAATDTTGTTIAGTFPSSPSTPVYRQPPPVRRAEPRTEPANTPMTSATSTSAPPTTNAPMTTDTQAAPPPQTDTTATTGTNAPTSTSKPTQQQNDDKPKEKKKDDQAPPPPPPTTDTTATGTQGQSQPV
jgi:hypothetical protein